MTIRRRRALWLGSVVALGGLLTVGGLLGASAEEPSVVIYDGRNFRGLAEVLGVGYHDLSDFNDITSSIKVRGGLVAVLYDCADRGGGYGESVDLLEDHADLSQMNFNDKASYVVVFRPPPGFSWSRNSIRNDQFVPGHWERVTPGGAPVNAIAVLSPPLPPHPPGAQPPSGPPGSVTVCDHTKPGPQPPICASAGVTVGDYFPFNLVWDSQALAPGGFPLNPRWQWQVDNAGKPSPSICHFFSNGDGNPSYADCTNQTHEENLPEGFNGWLCRVHNWFGQGFPGHLNWFTATYEGQASWTDSNVDDDYNVALVSSGSPGVMDGRDDLHTEFDADEMDVEHFVGPWWKAVYSAAENGDKFAVKPVFAPGGSIPAIVTGMFGIDCEHDGCKSEIHPVYAMALHINDDQADDAWAMFARNNGDEGYCSSKLVPADFTTYTFHLPWRADKTGVKVRSGTTWAGYPDGVKAPKVTWAPGQGVDVTFELPSADQSPLVEGELHLQWTGGGPAAPLPPAIIARRTSEPEGKSEPLAATVAKLPTDQRRALRRIGVSTGEPARVLRALPLRPAVRVQKLVSVDRAVVRGSHIRPPATAMIARDLAKMRALCRFAGETSDPILREACPRVRQ